MEALLLEYQMHEDLLFFNCLYIIRYIKLSIPIYFILLYLKRPDIPFTKYTFMLLLGWFLSEEVNLWFKTIAYLTHFSIYPHLVPFSPHSTFCLTMSKLVQELGNRPIWTYEPELELLIRPGIWCISQDYQAPIPMSRSPGLGSVLVLAHPPWYGPPL